MRRLIIHSIFLLFITAASYAQSTILKGCVTDSISKEKIPFATVILYNKDEFIDGTSTDIKGNFYLNISEVFTHLEVSFLGYKTIQFDLSEIENLNEIIVSLKVDATNLDEVIVNGKRTATQFKIDRKIINLGSDIQQSGISALEAMDQIIEVETDIDAGTVSLRGINNVRVLVNGRPSSLNSTELLQQISSSTIDHIEIITSPSAKHDADGISGIINVILKRNTNEGLNLGITSSGGTKRHNLGFNGNYGYKAINFRLSASNSSINEINTQTIYRQFKSGKTEEVFTPYNFDGNVYKITSGLDFYIRDKHEFSFEIDYTDDSHSYFNKSNYSNVTGRDNYEFLRKNSHYHYVTILNANYRLKLDDDQHFLELDYNVNSSKNNYPIADYEDNTLLFNQFLTEGFVLQSLALDYTFPLKNKILVETGISGNTQKLASENLFIPANNLVTRNQFEYDELLLGLYGMTKFSYGDINVQAGLRFEFFKSNSLNLTDNFKTEQNFSDLFPSVHFSYPINEENTLNLGYSKRVSRPNFHHINAFQIVNPLFVWEYNPDITPEISDNIELGYQKRGERLNMGWTSFYRHRKNAILWTESSKNDKQVFHYANSGTLNSYGCEANIKYEIAPFWDSNLAANYYFTKVEQHKDVTWDRLYSSSIQFKNTFKLGDILTSDLSFLYTPKRQNTYDYVEIRNRLDFSIRGQFFDNKLSASIRVVDVLNNNILKRTSITENLVQHTIWDLQSQTLNFLFSISYKLFENKKRFRSRKDRKYNEIPFD